VLAAVQRDLKFSGSVVPDVRAEQWSGVDGRGRAGFINGVIPPVDGGRSTNGPDPQPI
jgi:hypothetical protein